MANHFFGQFLIEKGLVTPHQLLQATLYQSQRNRLIGEIAIERGELTTEQVERTKAEQRKRDVYFGDAAIALGYLNQAQVDALLLAQKQDHIFIGEAVVKLGFMSEADLARELSYFKAEQLSQPASKRLIVFPEVPYRERMEPLIEMTQKVLTRVCGLQSHVSAQNVVKRGAEIPLFKWSACIGLQEPWRGSFIISASDRVARTIAEKRNGAMAQIVAPDAAMHDAAVKELATVTTRLAEGHMRQLGLKLDAGTAEGQPRTFALRGDRGLVVELVTPLGALHVVLTFS